MLNGSENDNPFPKPIADDTNRFFLAKLVIHESWEKSHICAGSLVNAKFILTAAHCVCDFLLNCTNKGQKLVVDSDSKL